MTKQQLLKRADLGPYHKLIVAVCLGRYFDWKRWMAEVGEKRIKQIQTMIICEEKVWDCLDTLTPRQRKVLILRYGLEGEKSKTCEEIGKEFCLTGNRISQIEAKGLETLRHPTRSRRLGIEDSWVAR